MTAAAVVLGMTTPAWASTPQSAKAAQRTKVIFSHLWTGPQAAAIQKIVSQFNASQDKITVVAISDPDFQKQLASMSASHGAFDISDNFGTSVCSWATKGILQPLTGYLKAAKVDLNDFVPATLNQMKCNGQIYELPVSDDDFELMYNKTEFAAAGIKAPPATMEQFATDIAKLTKVDKNGNITQLGFGNPDTGTTITTLGYAFGGTWDGTHNNSPSPQNPGAVAALNFYYDNITKKYGAARVQKFTAGWGQYQSPQDPFFTGKVAMVIDGEWQPPYIKTNAPHLKWGVAEVPYPAGDPRLRGTTQVTASTLFIPTNAPNKQGAFQFLNFLTSKKGMAEFSLALGVLPARESLISDPRYTATDPEFKVWLQALKSPNLHALGSNPYEAQYQSDYTTAFNDVLDGTMTPAQAIAQLVSEAKQYATSS